MATGVGSMGRGLLNTVVVKTAFFTYSLAGGMACVGGVEKGLGVCRISAHYATQTRRDRADQARFRAAKRANLCRIMRSGGRYPYHRLAAPALVAVGLRKNYRLILETVRGD